MKNNKISNTQLQAIVFLEMIGMEAMILPKIAGNIYTCLLYTSDAADEGLGVDLGGRRIIKKKFF